MRAFLNLRHSVPERRAAFVKGLERHGYRVVEELCNQPRERDILVSWNLIHSARHTADVFESRGLKVLVTENASWGNDFLGGHWYTLARGRHNTAGRVAYGGPDRWDRLGYQLSDWRGGSEVLILPQRGIGPPGVAMPHGWAERTQKATGGRIRQHPGQGASAPLEQDLTHAKEVRTWGSGAAIKALMWGIPVVSDMPDWIAEQDNTYAGRIEMFRRLAWAQWTLKEIADGEAFAHVLA